MIFTSKRILRENFLWIPLLIVASFNLLYFAFFGVFQIFIRILEGEPTRGTSYLVFIASALTVEGWGLPLIFVSNAFGVGIGLLAAVFIRTPFPNSFKRNISWFLVIFYTLLIGSFLYF